MWGSLRLAPIIYHEKSQLNRLVWGSLTLAPITRRMQDVVGASFIFLSVHSNSNDGLLSVYSNPKAGTT